MAGDIIFYRFGGADFRRKVGPFLTGDDILTKSYTMNIGSITCRFARPWRGGEGVHRKQLGSGNSKGRDRNTARLNLR